MKELLDKTKEAYKLAEKLEEILFSIESDMEWHDIENLDDYISNKYIKESMLKSINENKDEFNINEESNITYENDKEKRKAYYLGIVNGWNDALFFLCDSLDLINFYEEEIDPILDKHRLNLIKDK